MGVGCRGVGMVGLGCGGADVFGVRVGLWRWWGVGCGV